MMEATGEKLDATTPRIKRTAHGRAIGTDGPSRKQRRSPLGDNFAATAGKRERGPIEAATSHDGDERGCSRKTPRPTPQRGRRRRPTVPPPRGVDRVIGRERQPPREEIDGYLIAIEIAKRNRRLPQPGRIEELGIGIGARLGRPLDPAAAQGIEDGGPLPHRPGGHPRQSAQI